MFPVLIQIAGVKIYSYGFFIALGYLLAIFVGIRFGKRAGLSAENIVDLAFFSLVAGIIGARVLFVFTLLDYFRKSPGEIFLIWQGGLVFYGGLLAAAPVIYFYTRWKKLPLWSTLDVLALALVIGHAFGRIGCLGAGCCHGRACDLPWAIRIHSDMVDPLLRDVPLHPTQIYEAGALLVLFLVLRWIYLRKPKARDGTVAISYLLGYALIRGVIEIFRGDSIRGFIVPNIISTSQSISILVILFCALLLWLRRSRHNL